MNTLYFLKLTNENFNNTTLACIVRQGQALILIKWWAALLNNSPVLYEGKCYYVSPKKKKKRLGKRRTSRSGYWCGKSKFTEIRLWSSTKSVVLNIFEHSSVVNYADSLVNAGRGVGARDIGWHLLKMCEIKNVTHNNFKCMVISWTGNSRFAKTNCPKSIKKSQFLKKSKLNLYYHMTINFNSYTVLVAQKVF